MSDKLKGYDYSFGPKRRESSSTQRDQTSFFNAQNVAQPILAKLIHTWLHWRKVVHKFALFLTFSKKLPNENNHPISENSPNLVTLVPFQSV
jgi:hypothetical protein